MGTPRETFKQVQNGEFGDYLSQLLSSVDPLWEERAETEMDIFYRQAPLKAVATEDGVEMVSAQTCRPSTQKERDEGHQMSEEVVVSKVIPKGSVNGELEAIEA